MLTFTPTEKRILAVLSDGMGHTRDELFDCLSDELQNKGNVGSVLCNLRSKLLQKGETVVCVMGQGYKKYYQHFRLIRRD